MNSYFAKIQFYIHKKNNPILWTKTSEWFLHTLLKYICKTDNVIEIGCGTAHISYMLAKMGYSITINEIRPEAMEKIRVDFNNNHIKAKYLPGDLYKIKDHFDFAWNSGLIQCFPDEMKTKFVVKLAKCSKKILLFFPDITDPKKDVGKNKKRIPGVDDAAEYDISNVPLIIQSQFAVVHFGVLEPIRIDLPYKMFWIYGENT